METPHKYPSTGHWPWSETVHRDDTYHPDPERFVGVETVITEKLDGGNTCLFKGEVYARSTLSPSRDGWMAMVRKLHAWKTVELPMEFYGEDIYGIHSITYDPVPEDCTYYLFAARHNDWFASWDTVQNWARDYLDVPTVPVRFRGVFESVDQITQWFRENRPKGSVIGPEAEGFVIRVAQQFHADDFRSNVAKYVRPKHVQTDEHWRKNWQPCPIIGRKDA